MALCGANVALGQCTCCIEIWPWPPWITIDGKRTIGTTTTARTSPGERCSAVMFASVYSLVFREFTDSIGRVS